MDANIQGVDYEVRFQHRRLPGCDVRTPPTYDELYSAFALLKAELDAQGTIYTLLGDQDICSGEDLIDFMMDDMVLSHVEKSHVTSCFILSADRTQPFEQRLISSGITECDKRDNFDRAIGRQNSFNRAISAFPPAAQLEWHRWFSACPMRKAPAITVRRIKIPAHIAKLTSDMLALGKRAGKAS